MKKIVYLTLGFSSVTAHQNLYTDLIVQFQKSGHDILVVAPTIGKGNKMEVYTEEGIRLLRVPTLKLFDSGLIEKGLANVLLPFQFKRALKKSGIPIDFDLILLATPPITLVSVATWIKKRTNANMYLILRDIFPQNAVDLKMMSKSGILYKYFRNLETKLYQESNAIGCMSPENINYVVRHNPNIYTEKLHLLRNWEEIDESPPLSASEESRIRETYGLQDKIVAIYGGNLGLPQQTENIIHLAEAVRDVSDLVFLIFGRGTQTEQILKLIDEKKLENVVFRKGVFREEYNNILKLVDIGLISLNKLFSIPNYPSKVTGYYKYKIPVLSAIDGNTDFGTEQEEIGCGLWSLSGDTEAFKANLMKLYKDKALRKKMGQRGYDFYIENNLTPRGAYQTIINKI